MTVICRATAHNEFNSTIATPCTYDITVFRKDDPDQAIETIADVFSDLTTAKLFCQTINKNAVDELHFHDILEDTLAMC